MPILTRLALGYLVASGAAVGVWALGFPSGFYAAFPGLGHAWVAMDGPYNEHLVRDAGAAYLMMGALSLTGLLRPGLAAPFAVGVATLFFNGPHFAYHMTHLHMFTALDRVLNFASLGLAFVCSLWLMTPYAAAQKTA